ncbi:hypothetical protein NE237_017820 [Protea cynaroides]|uniref:Retrotransposon Copia-like N-terminal domain-containing protein n=1 Tax=Protea cynaroides TaxID=273540 RepID=A0A9Q0K8V4_9MAGN|nr:hypothetical protein NE237_017820 [Protea cynaroides]
MATSTTSDGNVSSNNVLSSATNSPPIVISNIVSLIPIKLTGTNYLLWKSLFEPILCGHKLMSLIDGSLPSPITVDSIWYEKDQMLLSWINATLSDSTLPYIVGVSLAKKAWDLLKHRYASTTPAHIIALKRLLSRIKKGSQSMNDYLQQFKSISDQLTTSASTVSNDDIIILILDGLPPSYRQFCSSIRIHAKTSDVTLEELNNLLLCEEIVVNDEIGTDQPIAMAAFRPNTTHASRSHSYARG